MTIKKDFSKWPLGKLSDAIERPEMALLKQAGYNWADPYDIVEEFERQVAEFAGSKYAVAVDCCSHGLFLAMKYFDASGTITIPSCTYVSVAMQVLHAGCQVEFEDLKWSGVYQLKPYPIWDGAVRWCRGMYVGGIQVVSFQIKKRIPIGRGGMILTDDQQAYNWLKKARHDGRDMSTCYVHDNFEFAGWHYYMTPEDAARGILLMTAIPGDYEDSGSSDTYVNLSTKTLFKNEN
jgi:dTDP-4-amino-4,6-dideoxygalactose transaminase